MPEAPSPPTTQENPRTEPLTHPITTMELPPQHRTTPDRNGFRDLPREWAVHNGTLRWDEIRPGLQAIRLHSITEPTTNRALPTGCHHLLLTVQGDATITPTEGDPVTAAPAHAVHIPPQASSAPMAVHPGPNPWQAIVITYPTPNDHTHTWQQPWEDSHKRRRSVQKATVGGHPGGPPPRTPRARAHPPHPTANTRSRLSTTRHTQPGIMGVRHTHKPTSSGGH